MGGVGCAPGGDTTLPTFHRQDAGHAEVGASGVSAANLGPELAARDGPGTVAADRSPDRDGHIEIGEGIAASRTTSGQARLPTGPRGTAAPTATPGQPAAAVMAAARAHVAAAPPRQAQTATRPR